MKHTRHHFVPVSYLRQWADGAGRIHVCRRKGNGFKSSVPSRPEAECFERGLYDLGPLTGFIPGLTSDFLERAIFAQTDEAAFPENLAVLNRTAPEVPERVAGDLLRFAICLYYRNPKFIRMGRESSGPPTLETVADRIVSSAAGQTLALVLDGSFKVINKGVMVLYKASTTSRFDTSDTPSWLWADIPVGLEPIECFKSFNGWVDRYHCATRWICPLSPDWCLEFNPTIDPVQQVTVLSASDQEVAQINSRVRKVAARLCIEPPSPTTPLAAQNK